MPLIEISADLDCHGPAPVEVELAQCSEPLPDGPLELREEGGGLRLPAQLDGDRLVVLVSGLEAGESRRFRLAAAQEKGRVELKEEGPHALSIYLPDGLFTTYNFDPQHARPFFHPVFGPERRRVTRDFPMIDVAEEKQAKDQDHPHHRSFWTAYDEVNGVDNWSEAAGKHGWTRHQKFTRKSGGTAYGGFVASSVWTSHDGKPVLDERRAIRVYNVGPDRRLLDYEVHLIASHGDVEYGDTKEGGILAFRVFHTIKGGEGGKMMNSERGVGEKQVWGKRAQWLDYSGPVQGKVVGIAMMDHPGNLNHPCRWHARDYGLVGTNPFANAAFGASEKTPYHQKKGETLRFRYRVLIHPGDATEARVSDAYHEWVQKPAARLIG
ncbi:MAG: PmoA family protein [Armatimonadota bacterium]